MVGIQGRPGEPVHRRRKPRPTARTTSCSVRPAGPSQLPSAAQYRSGSRAPPVPGRRSGRGRSSRCRADAGSGPAGQPAPDRPFTLPATTGGPPGVRIGGVRPDAIRLDELVEQLPGGGRWGSAAEAVRAQAHSARPICAVKLGRVHAASPTKGPCRYSDARKGAAAGSTPAAGRSSSSGHLLLPSGSSMNITCPPSNPAAGSDARFGASNVEHLGLDGLPILGHNELPRSRS